MCSIFGVLEVRQDLDTVRKMALRQSRLQRHRGPDWSGVHAAGSAVLAHELAHVRRGDHRARPGAGSGHPLRGRGRAGPAGALCGR